MEYELRYGEVWKGDRHICGPHDMLAVAFDERLGVLHKHGRADLVRDWVDMARRRFLAQGMEGLADDLAVIEFRAVPETISELNACVATSGRVGLLAKRLSAVPSGLVPEGNRIPPAPG